MPLFAADASIYWNLPILLIVFSLVYSATRHDRWDRILREALGWGFRVGGFLLTVGVALYVASSVPDYWPYLLSVAIAAFVVYSAVSWMRTRKSAAKPAAPNS